MIEDTLRELEVEIARLKGELEEAKRRIKYQSDLMLKAITALDRAMDEIVRLKR